MPKERTHWLLAFKAREKLPAGHLKNLLKARENAYLLGAVAPDSVFFPLDLGRGREKHTHFFHGQGSSDTFRFWRQAAEREWLFDEERTAFLYGLTSHIVSDAVFHPAVHYFSGWPDHPDRNIARGATSRHFRLEALLDLYLGNYFQYDPSRVMIKDMLKEIDVEKIAETAGLLFFPWDPLEVDVMKKLFEKHAFYQERYGRRDYLLLSWLLKIIGISVQGKRDLFYRQPMGSFRERQLEYVHPVTGEALRITWVKAAEDAAIRAAEIMAGISSLLQAEAYEEIPPGPHPDFGISSDRAAGEKMLHCGPVRPESLFR